MMNWSWIILGLVALSSVSYAENSYLVILPKLLKVGYDNQISVFIASAPEPVEVKFDLVLGERHLDWKLICKTGETRNATWTLPKEFPVGAAELTITGTGGLRFVEKRDMIVYDNRHVILVETSASNYFPRDIMEVRVVVTDEYLIPLEDGLLDIEIYDAALKLVGEFPRVPIRYGLTETLRFPIAEHCNIGSWLVSAIIGNTTSSMQVLVANPITPSFDLKAIFQRFLLRTDKFLRGVIEIDDDHNAPIFGRGKIYIGPMTEQEIELKMKREFTKEEAMKREFTKEEPTKREFIKDEPMKTEEWRKWKFVELEIAGRLELNYDLLSLFDIDVSKCIAVQVYIEVTDLISGQDRIIRHIIPVFMHNVIYDIRPLEFEAGIKNEYEIIAKRPDGKPVKMEEMIVTCRMIIGDEHGKPKDEKVIEIKDFYTRGRNDIGFFNVEFPENCIGVLMTITPVSEDGKMRGYRTHALPLMPVPRHQTAKLSIELLPSKVAPVNTDVDVPVISSQISTVGRTSNFYVQLLPIKPVEKFEPVPMSYVLMTNGRITLTGEFMIEPTKECRSKTVRTISPEEQKPLPCVFNGTLPIYITRDMVPYSTLLVYTFQPLLGFNVAETYRFSVAGLFQSSLTLNATLVPYTPTEKMIETFPFLRDTMMVKPIRIPSKVQERTRVELSFTGVPESTVGLNVFEYDGVLRGLTNEITKERLLKYLTTYEHVPMVSMPSMPPMPLSEDMMMRREMVPDHMMMDKNHHNMPVSHGIVPPMNMPGSHGIVPPTNMPGSHGIVPPTNMPVRRTISESDEEMLIERERKGHEVRYPVEKMIFGLESTNMMTPVEGDDIYMPSYMGRFYGDVRPHESFSHYRRKFERSMNQYDVTVDDNDFVVATSVPLVFTADATVKPKHEKRFEMPMMMEDEHLMREKPVHDNMPSWFEKMNSKFMSFTPESLKFMRSGLTIVSDFDSLRIPTDMKRENLTKLFWRFNHESTRLMDDESFSMRDEARELLEEYISKADLSMMMPPVMFEEQARTGYYRSIFFNTSRIESSGVGKVVLPPLKPYSTWLATGFALNQKSGLSIAQPIRLPTNEGLFVLADCPEHVKVREQVLFTYGINNYLRKDLSKVMFRIRASPDFDLIEPTKPEIVMSMKDKDYSFTLPLLKSYDVEIRHLIVVPKRSGVIQIVCEVESELGGDYEITTMFVREDGIVRPELKARLFDLTSDKKMYGPIVEKWTPTPSLRSVNFVVSGTGLDHLVRRYTMEMNSLVGIDRALVCLYRALGLRRYLNETMQFDSPLWNMTTDNITTCYEHLQVYNDYDGSYSFISDEGTKHSSLYLTSLAFGAMISPMMPFRDNVTLNRTLTWILSQQREDGSFDHMGPCFHYRFCSGEFRRESLTAIVLYSLTKDNATEFMPEFIRHMLYNGEMSPIMRATHYLISRVPEIKPHYLPITLFEMAFIQNREITPELREKIHKALLSRKLTVDSEDGSKYIKVTDDKLTYDDQLLINSMSISLYSWFGDYKTATDMARWVVDEIETHPFYDTILDAVFHTDAWLKLDCLFRKKFGVDKYGITIDVTADNGEKKIFKIDSKNIDVTQLMHFTSPVHQITYSVSGFGLCCVRLVRIYSDEKPEKLVEPMPFLLTHEFKPMPWFSEINTKTCMTYTPTMKDLVVPKEFNRTMVVEIILPSGMRINERQIGFFLSRVEHVLYFTYEPCGGKLSIFINVPSTMFGKEICFEWCLERLSTVFKWSPMYVRVYDYMRPDIYFVKLFPIQFQPSVLGYSFVDAVHKARPTLESLPLLQKKQL